MKFIFTFAADQNFFLPMDRLQLLLCSLLLCTFLNAQQLPLFTQYREYQTIINPASVGSNYLTSETNLSFGASYRSQWTGLENGPTTATLRVDHLFENSGFSLLSGGYVMHDQTGPTGFTGLYGRIGGLISDDPYYGGIAVAISGGVSQFRVKGSEIRLYDDNEAIVDENTLYPDVGFGVFAYKQINRKDYIYGGISVPQILGLDLSIKNDQRDYQVTRVQHFYASAGLIKFFRDDSFIEPSVWVKYVENAPVNADFNFRYRMKTNFWIGMGASTGGNFHAETGIILGQSGDSIFKIGYGFDYSFSRFGPFAGTTHEVNISYSLSQ